MTNKFTLNKQNKVKLQGNVKIPGDKSISHRSLIMLSLCLGDAKINNLLESDDVIATKAILNQLGVNISKSGEDYIVSGNGRFGFKQSDKPLDCGNSGTTARLISGMVSTLPITSILFGDESLSKRPMGRTIRPMQKFGVEFSARENSFLPMQIQGSRDSIGIDYEMEVASAQVKSGVLLAGIHAQGTSSVYEKIPTRDHTEIMMKYLGFNISQESFKEGVKISINQQEEVKAKDLIIPGDPSSAAFIVALALLVEDSDIILENICINPTRTGFFDIVKLMGANIEYLNQRNQCGELVADIRVQYSKLNSIETNQDIVANAIDEFPILSILASFTKGTSRFNGLKELRVKESDRLNAININLNECGVDSYIEGDDLIINGNDKASFKFGKIQSFLDHRIAMSFIIFGLVSNLSIEIDYISKINTSFPTFFELLTNLGFKI